MTHKLCVCLWKSYLKSWAPQWHHLCTISIKIMYETVVSSTHCECLIQVWCFNIINIANNPWKRLYSQIFKRPDSDLYSVTISHFAIQLKFIWWNGNEIQPLLSLCLTVLKLESTSLWNCMQHMISVFLGRIFYWSMT